MNSATPMSPPAGPPVAWLQRWWHANELIFLWPGGRSRRNFFFFFFCILEASKQQRREDSKVTFQLAVFCALLWRGVVAVGVGRGDLTCLTVPPLASPFVSNSSSSSSQSLSLSPLQHPPQRWTSPPPLWQRNTAQRRRSTDWRRDERERQQQQQQQRQQRRMVSLSAVPPVRRCVV